MIMEESERVKTYNNEILSQKLSNDQKVTELLKRLEGIIEFLYINKIVVIPVLLPLSP